MDERELARLNKREDVESIMRRLLIQARGKKFTVSLISALEFRREAYGLSCTKFAKVLGMGKSHYSEVLSGKRRLPYEALKRAYRVGVPADALMQPLKERA